MPTQEEINDGQQKINGELCRVDWRLTEALKQVLAVLAASPGNAGVDLTSLSTAIDKAEEIGAKVADIKPPGCGPLGRTT